MKSKKFKTTIFFTSVICAFLAVVFLFPGEGLAQGLPGLPTDPEQTPIDGGLGILAVLGGTYAISKLKEKKDF